jgi:septum formation protein
VEELEAGDPTEVALENARRKALAGSLSARTLAGLQAAPALAGSAPVLGVDTLVALEGQIFGKPGDPAAARSVLDALSGQRHEVVSGLAVCRPGGALETAVERTAVEFRSLDSGLLDW